MAHTKGPWEIYMDKFVPTEMEIGSKMYVIQTADEHKDNVGFACSWLDDPETLKEARANAKLIAAAPELLEALEALFDDYKQLADSGDAGFWSLEDMEVGKIALAAIAKAKGLNPDQG